MRIRVLLTVAIAGLLMTSGMMTGLAVPQAGQTRPAGVPAPAPAAAVPAVPSGVPAAAASPAAQAAQHKAVLDRYCVTCHNDRTRTGGLSLQGIDLTNLAVHGETLEKVVRRVEAGMMPPQGLPRPDAATQAGLISWVKSTLDRAALEHPNPGRALLRRLNRAEYANAVRDLLALDIDVASLLPPDDSSYGFDNIADVLGSSPALLERYLNAADEISAVAIGSLEDNVASSKTYVAPSDTTQNEHVDGLPLGTRGGMLIRHTFPVDGEYLFKVKLWRNNSSSIRGLSLPHDLEISIDGERVFVTTIGTPEDYKALLTNPGDAEGLIDPRTQARVKVSAGPHPVSVAFVFKSDAPNVTLLRPLLASHDPISVDGFPRVDWVLVGGPFEPTGPGDTPSRRRVLVCTPTSSARAAEDACANRILRTLARRAYRRPVTADDLKPLVEFYNQGRAKGNFDTGIRTALKRLLTDPSFLFRPEMDVLTAAPGTTARISDVELASRISFFLWSSGPDDELLDVASRGQLRAPGMLARQVKRMLADPKASALVSNFAGQWLFLRNLQQSRPDTQEFPDFDDSLRQSFRQETEMLFDYLMREDRSILELLTADYTFVNERLARHYRIPGVYGSRFRRVTVTDPTRMGILGHGSVLTVTSYPNRTSPVRRGKWILENLLGTPPPPPPPNVPPLAESAGGSRPKTMKAQMEAHRANPTCANCHRLMDPLGFAMENFDGVGAWRVKDGPSTIDATSTLADGTKVDGVVSLRQAVLRRPDLFAATATEKLMIYALGRGLQYYDMPAVRKVVETSRPADYRFSSLVLGIINSVPFQMRMKPYPDGADPSVRAAR
jgi:mono/diheme cytochrome c family protein